MKQRILVFPITIHRQGEQQFFQVNVPSDVERITGILPGIQLINVPAITGLGQIGRLQLQANGQINLCYNSIVRLEPAAALKIDLGLTCYQAGFALPSTLLKDGLAQRRRYHPEIISLPYCSIFYGNYKDMLGYKLKKDINYTVTIALWAQYKN